MFKLKPAQAGFLQFNEPRPTHIISKRFPSCIPHVHFVHRWLLSLSLPLFLSCHSQLLLPVSAGDVMSSCQLVPTVNYYMWDCGAGWRPAACGVGWRILSKPWQLSKGARADSHSLFICMIHLFFLCDSRSVRLKSFDKFWSCIPLIFPVNTFMLIRQHSKIQLLLPKQNSIICNGMNAYILSIQKEALCVLSLIKLAMGCTAKAFLPIPILRWRGFSFSPSATMCVVSPLIFPFLYCNSL